MKPKFEIIWGRKLHEIVETLDISRCQEICLIDAKQVTSVPTTKYAVAFPTNGICSGIKYIYPDGLKFYRYRLNGKEISLPTDTIEHFWKELYTLINNEYTRWLLETL